MNLQDFTQVLQNPKSISFQQTEAIKSVIHKYPYLQSARAVYLKGLNNQNSINYNKELKITAAYTSDRSVLFDFITSEDFIQNEISKQITQNIANSEDTSLSNAIDKSEENEVALKQQINATENFEKPELPESIEEVSPEKQTTTNETYEPPANILNLGKPLQFDKDETHSFSEWLNLTRIKPIDRAAIETKPLEKQDTKTTSKKAKKFELIDKFITQNPKINTAKTIESTGNLAKAQMIKPEALMTETLARIYVEQKNYKSAIQSYKILSLKYPEKSSFFASQIEAVKQLQEQNNKSE